MPERSATVIRYSPGLSRTTRLPFLVRLIVKPGPTVARNVVTFVRPPATAVSASAAPAVASAATIAMRVILTPLLSNVSYRPYSGLAESDCSRNARGEKAAGQGFEPQ